MDDHLRNHWFLLSPQGWQLSPIYDVNPTPAGSGLTLNISDTDNSLNIDLARSVASIFRIKPKQAEDIFEYTLRAVAQWPKIATSIGIPRGEMEMIEGAFSHNR